MCLKQKWFTMGQAAKELGYSFGHFNKEHKNLAVKLNLVVETIGSEKKPRYYFRKDSVQAVIHNSDVQARQEIK